MQTSNSLPLAFRIRITCWLIALILSGQVLAFDLMIVCPAEFREALQPLARYKTRTWISTQIVTLEQIRENFADREGIPFVDEPERIKYAIYHYHRDHNVRYVMLVGDCNVLPVRFTRGYLDDYSPDRTSGILEMTYEPSDLYYADIEDAAGNFATWDHDSPPNQLCGEIYRDGINWDEVDYHPDVSLGRIPAAHIADVWNYVAKVIRYEMSTAGQAWFTNVVVSVRDEPKWDAVTHTEAIIDALPGFHPTRYYHSNIPRSEIPAVVASNGDPTARRLQQSYEDGCGFAFHHGHGGLQSWSGSFDVGCVSRLTNTNRLPIIFCVSCETSRYCPYVPYQLYFGNDGLAHGPSPRDTIGATIFPEPNPIQDFPYNLTRTIGEEFIVGSEAGAIAYWGCVNTGERTSQTLALEFFNAYAPGMTLGSMWHQAVELYHTTKNLSRYNRDFNGNAGNMWEFHTPERFPLFGDPSLRVGGVNPPETDTTPPVTTDNVPGAWVSNPFTLALSATDEGSGVYHTYLRFGTDGWMGDFIELRTGHFVTVAGSTQAYVVEYYSVDFFGNIERTNRVEFAVDGIPPQNPRISLSGPPSTVNGMDFGGPVRVSLTSADAESGLRYHNYQLERGVQTGSGTYYYTPAGNGIVSGNESFLVNTSGRWRIRVRAEDAAGNRSAEVTEEFSTAFIPEITTTALWELADILAGPWDIGFPPKLELPIKPLEVSFYYRILGGEWKLLFRDTKAEDGWGGIWQTEGVADDIYDIQAVLKPGSKQLTLQNDVIIPLMRCAVRNLSGSSYVFLLDETPRVVDQGQAVRHQIQYVQKGAKPLSNLEILFNASLGKQYDLKSVEPSPDGAVDKNGVIRWTRKQMNPGEIWQVEFKARALNTVPSGQHVPGQAYLGCDEIPILTSDDPKTELLGDPTYFVVQAKGGQIKGRVTTVLLEPLAGTSVALSNQKTITTDAEGNYVFANLLAGTYTLSASLPPGFAASKEKTLAVDGNTVTADLVLERNDLIPPTVFLEGLFEDYVSERKTTFTGTALDNPNGSGVALVEGCLRRLSDNLYWNAKGWQSAEVRFQAKGTEVWTLSLPELNYQPDQAYSLGIWAVDAKKNSGAITYYSEPPAPTGLNAAPAGSIANPGFLFTWDLMPGCGYLLEVSQQPHFGAPLLIQHLKTNKFLLTKSLPAGKYYCRAYAALGQNLFGPGSKALEFAVTAAAPVALAISREKHTLVIHWPATAAGYELQSAEALSPPKWFNVDLQPVLVGDRLTIVVEPANITTFYRLAKP